MTTNIDRAAEVLHEMARRESAEDGFPKPEWEHEPEWEKNVWLGVARALADAGLLAPGLPEPIINADDGNPEWHADEYTVDVDRGLVGLWTPDGTHWEQTPNRARLLADALYAAADHAEEASHAQDD